MRFLILSDIHGNIDALEAVLARAPRDSYDRLLVLARCGARRLPDRRGGREATDRSNCVFCGLVLAPG